MACSFLALRSGLKCNTFLPMLSKNLSFHFTKDLSKVSYVAHGYHSLSQSQLKLCSASLPLVLRSQNQVQDAKGSGGRKSSAIDRVPTHANSPLMQILQEKEKPYSELTTGEKVVRVGKDAGYSLVVVCGILVGGAIAVALYRGVLSSDSPTGVYKRALKLVKNNEEIQVTLGSPIKAYGETSGRSRRNRMSHVEYVKDGVKHMRMKFYVEGPAIKGTVQLETQKVDGSYEFRYVFVDVHHRTIVIEDNRASLNTPLPRYEYDNEQL